MAAGKRNTSILQVKLKKKKKKVTLVKEKYSLKNWDATQWTAEDTSLTQE